MLDLHHHVAHQGLLSQCLLDSVDRRARNLPTHVCQPFLRAPGQEASLQIGDQIIAVLIPAGERRIARVGSQFRRLQDFCKSSPELLFETEDHDVTVLCPEHLGRVEGRVGGVGQPLWMIVAVERPDGDIVQHAECRVEQADIHVAALAAVLCMAKARQQPDHRYDARREVS